MILDIALALANLRLEFRFKGNLIILTSYDLFRCYIQYMTLLLFDTISCSFSLVTLLYQKCYLSTSRIPLSRTVVNCPTFLTWLPNPYNLQNCKRRGNTLRSCTQKMSTKQSISQNFFHFIFILVHVHVLIVMLILFTHTFLMFKRKSLSSNTLIFLQNSTHYQKF